MQMRQLGTSEVKVSPVIFGAWAIGGWMWGGQDEADSIEAIRASIDAGVTSIDTAAMYGQGYSEEVLAKALKGRRDKAQVLTKCGMRWDAAGDGDKGTDPWPQKNNDGQDITILKNSKPASIAYECEQSLKRLKTDYIDLYQIHWPDTSTPVEESMNAMAKLKQQGKIRGIGVSNYDAAWLDRAQNALRQAQDKSARLASNQPPYSLMQRSIEKSILPFCREQGIGVIVYSPLERGLLTGKVTVDRKFPEGDHRAEHKFFTPEMRQKVLDALATIQPIADKHKASLAQVVINWTIHEPGITAALVGARSAEQATHNAGAVMFTLTDAERKQVRAAFDAVASF
ncbi:MAG: aldo/keto reductase [Tepidisphaeraceae bacterium]